MGEWGFGEEQLGKWKLEVVSKEEHTTFIAAKAPLNPEIKHLSSQQNLEFFFPSSRVAAGGKQRESHAWIHAKCRRAWAAAENVVRSLDQEVETGMLMNLRE